MHAPTQHYPIRPSAHRDMCSSSPRLNPFLRVYQRTRTFPPPSGLPFSFAYKGSLATPPCFNLYSPCSSPLAYLSLPSHRLLSLHPPFSHQIELSRRSHEPGCWLRRSAYCGDMDRAGGMRRLGSMWSMWDGRPTSCLYTRWISFGSSLGSYLIC